MEKTGNSHKKQKSKKSLRFRMGVLLGNGLLMVVLLISLWKIGDYSIDKFRSKSFSRKIQNNAVIMDEVKEEGYKENVSGCVPAAIDFDNLYSISDNVIGWIYAPDTELNDVIAQAEDNDYYLHRLLDGTTASEGTIFADYRSSADFSDWNTILYGHNMKNGRKFKTLMNYRDSGYYEEHPTMYLYTPEHSYRLEIIAGYTTNQEDPIYRMAGTEEERDEIIKYAIQASSFSSKVVVEDEDRLVTLSTCAYDYDEARYVVIGKLVEEKRK